MLKEIREQPRTIRDTMRGRVTPDNQVIQRGLGILLSGGAPSTRSAGRPRLAYYAGYAMRYFFERVLRPVELEVASEFRYRDPTIDERTLFVVISQSGETADSLAPSAWPRAGARRRWAS